jgi:hypothetical protein
MNNQWTCKWTHRKTPVFMPLRRYAVGLTEAALAKAERALDACDEFSAGPLVREMDRLGLKQPHGGLEPTQFPAGLRTFNFLASRRTALAAGRVFGCFESLISTDTGRGKRGEDEVLVGYVFWHALADDEGTTTTGYIGNLSVAETHVRRGLGGQLVMRRVSTRTRVALSVSL